MLTMIWPLSVEKNNTARKHKGVNWWEESWRSQEEGQNVESVNNWRCEGKDAGWNGGLREKEDERERRGKEYWQIHSWPKPFTSTKFYQSIIFIHPQNLQVSLEIA